MIILCNPANGFYYHHHYFTSKSAFIIYIFLPYDMSGAAHQMAEFFFRYKAFVAAAEAGLAGGTKGRISWIFLHF